MSSARDELYNLADSEDVPQNENSSSHSRRENLTKNDISSAIDEYFTTQKKQAQEVEQNDRQRKIDEQNQREQAELQEAASVVKKSLQEEMSKDKHFAEIVQKSDLPGNLIEYIAEVGEPEEAALIVREIANNEEYQQSLKRSRTEVGMKRLLNKVRKSVLMGGGVQKVPEIIKKDIANYNYNNSDSSHDEEFYSDMAMRHGI